jgi:hypothetical protein
VQAAARAAHRLEADEPLVVLYDATVFGTTALGIALTSRSLLWRNFGEEPSALPFASIDPDFLAPSCDTLLLGHHRIEIPTVLARAFAALLAELVPPPAAPLGPYREPPLPADVTSRGADEDPDALPEGSPADPAAPGVAGETPMTAREIAVAAFSILAGSPGVSFAPFLSEPELDRARRRYALPPGDSIAVTYIEPYAGQDGDGFLLTTEAVVTRVDDAVQSRRYPRIEPHTIKVFEGTVRVLGAVVPFPASSASPDQFAALLRRIVRRAGGEDVT